MEKIHQKTRIAVELFVPTSNGTGDPSARAKRETVKDRPSDRVQHADLLLAPGASPDLYGQDVFDNRITGFVDALS